MKTRKTFCRSRKCGKHSESACLVEDEILDDWADERSPAPCFPVQGRQGEPIRYVANCSRDYDMSFLARR